MASRYSIESVFSLVDRVSAPTSKIGRALDSLGIKSKAVSNALKNDFDKAADRVDRLGKSIKRAAGYMAAAGFAAVGAGVAIATKQFVDFDNALHKAGAIFSDLDSGAEDFQDRLKNLGTQARNVAAITEFNAQQTANALATMAMAGIESDQAVALLPKVADMATAAGVEIDKAVGMAADSLNVFGKMTSDPTKLAENFQYVSDIMVKTANLANMDINMMYEAVGAGGGEFKKANQRLEDFGAAVDVLASNNIKGAEAGNSINVMMTRLAAPAKKGQDAIAKLGLKTRDSQNNLLNFVDIIDQLNIAFKGMGTADQAAYIDAIFGKNHYQAASYLITAGREGLESYSKQLEDVAGSTERVAAVMRNSLQNRIEVLKSSLLELGFKFVDAFAEKGGNALEKLTNAVNNFDVTPLVNAAQSAISVIQVFGGLLVTAVKIAWQFRYAIVAIAVPLLVYQGALMAITIATSIYTKFTAIARVVTAAVTGAQMAYAIAVKGSAAAQSALAFATKETVISTKIWSAVMGVAVKAKALFTGATIAQTAAMVGSKIAMIAATAAQWALNVAMTANPIGIIIVGVGALIAALVLLIKNWGKVTAAIKNNTNKVMTILVVLLGPLGFIISMIKEVASNWARIKEALAATGLFEKIKEIGGAIRNFIQPAINWLIDIWTTVKNAVGGFFSYIVNGIKTFFEPAVNWIVNAWHTATSVIGGFFKGIFDAVYNFVKPALDFFSEKWQQIVSLFTDNAIINAIKVIGGTLISGLLAPVQGLLEIASNLPGLGHLAGKGAAKIEELRNFLKGGEKTTVTASVDMPKTVTAQMTPPVDTRAGSAPAVAGLNIPGASGTDINAGAAAGGRSPLHGVVDISGGAVVNPIMSASGGGTYTASSATGSTAVSGIPETVTRNIAEITAVLRKIDSNIYTIANILPGIIAGETATHTSLDLPRVNMSGDEDAPDYENPRAIAPITQAERMAYSVEERIQRIIIEVAAKEGTAARVIQSPRNSEIELVYSGSNA